MSMYSSAKTGWYKMINADKFIVPTVESQSVMKSYKIIDGEITVNYRSSLELACLRYCDYNKHIVKFSLEPLSIPYLKPTDGKIHRYFVDFYIEFSTGDKFLVEIKSSGETREPQIPKKKTQKAVMNYNTALQTFAVNTAKWDAARKFALQQKMKFIILTENELR